MDATWVGVLSLLLLTSVPLLHWTGLLRAERTGLAALLFYAKMGFYVAWMMLLALLAIPLCLLKSGGRDVENMRILCGMAAHVKYLLGLRYRVSGRERLEAEEGPYVIVSNHQSSLDVLGQLEVLPARCTMVARKQLMYVGTVGAVCWLGGMVFIDRGKTANAKTALDEAAETMLRERLRLWVFPEGTRNTAAEDLLPFKKGAFHLAVRAQVPVIPVVFSSYGSFYRREERRFGSGTVRVRVLPKMETAGLTSEDVAALSERAFDAMRAAFLDISSSSDVS